MNLITISRSAILHNFDLLQGLHRLPLIPVLKANAYGHGAAEVATILKHRSFPLIAVDGYYEALAIRKVSTQSILVMGSIGDNDINKLRAKNISFVVFSPQSFASIAKARRTQRIHLEINTGMNRHGLGLDELRQILTELKSYPKLRIEGIFTHLSSADELSQKYSELQFAQLHKALQIVKKAGIHPKYVHATNSAGTAKNLPSFITAVRPGIALYGINTLSRKDPFYANLSALKPALTLTSKIDHITTVQAGDTVGYNRTYRATKPTTIATIPIGYYEGIPRSFSNKPFITIDGVLVSTAGTICMNHTMFDCQNTIAKIGDRVTLISSNPRNPNSITSLRRRYDQFEYTLPTGLRSTIRRRIIE